MLMNRSDVFVQHERWRGRGTANCRAPPPGGRAPIGPACVADIVSEPTGVETAWGVLEITEGIFTRPAEVAHGCIVDLGDIDRRAISGSSAASQWHSVPAVRFDAIAGLLGQE